MYTIFTFVIACAVIAQGYPSEQIDIVQDEYGQEYYLLPVQQISSRTRRDVTQPENKYPIETKWDVRPGGGEVKQTLVNTKDHLATATLFGQRAPDHGPLTTGQEFNYQHKPTASEFDLKAQNTRGWGDDLSARGTYNFFQTDDKRGKIGAYGDYSRHYGGPAGTLSPQWGVGIRGVYNFP